MKRATAEALNAWDGMQRWWAVLLTLANGGMAAAEVAVGGLDVLVALQAFAAGLTAPKALGLP